MCKSFMKNSQQRERKWNKIQHFKTPYHTNWQKNSSSEFSKSQYNKAGMNRHALDTYNMTLKPLEPDKRPEDTPPTFSRTVIEDSGTLYIYIYIYRRNGCKHTRRCLPECQQSKHVEGKNQRYGNVHKEKPPTNQPQKNMTQDVTPHELNYAIRLTKMKKAPGQDGITMK